MARMVGGPDMGEREVADPACELLTFRLDDHRFALRARFVQEVVGAVTVSKLPDAPPVIEGAVNYRSRIVPVIDVRFRLGLPAREIDPSHHLIVAEAGFRRVALRVDHALDLIGVAEDAIESASRVTPGARYTEGVARLADGLVVIHDLERFLSLDEGRVLDAAMDAAGSQEGDAG